MLDVETRRRIDTARDILVGKVPDPKSQVEQITIALIYKFMWDIEAQSEEVGGKGSYFVGEFARYAWPKLMRSGLGGFETLNLYAEALTRIPENPGIPPLFRNIFDNAYLPYRDPETLREFLKVIDQFEYDHSERLGDAFEYLLSIMGAQGDAGQFRTPRHIIDFMVDVVDPRLYETVLDPACGTAGFLISAFKHIQRANTDEDGQSTLTPHEHGRLAKSLTGYDISPDMVRLSLVNMYLHGFVKPDIHEYDTLTSEERWDERADVILANPPFMSPRGGIRPHNRFSVQAKRSEVLFVDYMAEHLTPTGRAGIIVPEGVIFQSQRAHTQLRQMLVEDYLVAVVSLPAGVFQPYSGVKTSILILDRSLARRTDRIAFLKVENDGFDLGAQRRPIDQNDLPQVRAELTEYLRRVRVGALPCDYQPELGLVVEKERVAADGDFYLAGDRYREEQSAVTSYPWCKIGSLVETVTPPAKIPKTEFADSGLFPVIDQSQSEIAGWTNDRTALVSPRKPLVIFGDHTCIVKIIETPFAQGADGIKILDTKEGLDPRFLYHALRCRGLQQDGYRRHYSKLKEYEIPVPPLEVQHEIVAEIESYQKVIDGARAVIDNYRPQVPSDTEWSLVALGEACEVIFDGTHFSPKNTDRGDRLYLTSKNVRENHLDLSNVRYISEDDHRSIYERCPVKRGDVLYIKDGANTGLAAINTLEEPFSLLSSVAVLRGKANVLDNRFLAFSLNTIEGRKRMLAMMSGVAIRRLTLTKISQAEIPLPYYDEQQKIVAELEAEQLLVAANRKLIQIFEQKIKTAIAGVWMLDG